MGLLSGKVALITGAARGIGKSIALKYAKEGADIAFTDLVIDENAENTKKEIESYGVRVLAIASNAASFEEAHAAVEKVHSEMGRIDILVNNAGITKDGLILRMSEGQWDGAGQLFRIQGRHDRACEIRCSRARLTRNTCQRSRSGLYRYGHDGQAA